MCCLHSYLCTRRPEAAPESAGTGVADGFKLPCGSPLEEGSGLLSPQLLIISFSESQLFPLHSGVGISTAVRTAVGNLRRVSQAHVRQLVFYSQNEPISAMQALRMRLPILSEGEQQQHTERVIQPRWPGEDLASEKVRWSTLSQIC